MAFVITDNRAFQPVNQPPQINAVGFCELQGINPAERVGNTEPFGLLQHIGLRGLRGQQEIQVFSLNGFQAFLFSRGQATENLLAVINLFQPGIKAVDKILPDTG